MTRLAAAIRTPDISDTSRSCSRCTHPGFVNLQLISGIGPVAAATLISELGEDRNRFPAVEALLAEAGLAPVTKACGRTRQVRFRYAANRRMRHAIDW